MAISHADHDHPATPAARAACRKLMGAIKDKHGATGRTTQAANFAAALEYDQAARKPAGTVRLVGVEPRRTRRANGGAPVADRRRFIRDEGDMPGVPHVFSAAIRHAWHQEGWTVQHGNPYNDTEKRIVIDNGHGDQLVLIYKAGQHHVNAVDYHPAQRDGDRRRGIRVGQAPHVSTGLRMLRDRVTIEGPMTTPMN